MHSSRVYREQQRGQKVLLPAIPVARPPFLLLHLKAHRRRQARALLCAKNRRLGPASVRGQVILRHHSSGPVLLLHRTSIQCSASQPLAATGFPRSGLSHKDRRHVTCTQVGLRGARPSLAKNKRGGAHTPKEKRPHYSVVGTPAELIKRSAPPRRCCPSCERRRRRRRSPCCCPCLSFSARCCCHCCCCCCWSTCLGDDAVTGSDW